MKKLEHVGLSVSNIERSINFYCNNFGFKVIRTIEVYDEDRKIKMGKITGMKIGKAKIAHLISENFMLELFEYIDPKGKQISTKRTQADIGLTHIGFRTNDIFKNIKELKLKNVKFISEPVEFRKGVWVVYFYGPDGEVCELRQTPEEW